MQLNPLEKYNLKFTFVLIFLSTLKSELRLMDPDSRDARPALSPRLLRNSGGRRGLGKKEVRAFSIYMCHQNPLLNVNAHCVPGAHMLLLLLGICACFAEGHAGALSTVQLSPK